MTNKVNASSNFDKMCQVYGDIVEDHKHLAISKYVHVEGDDFSAAKEEQPLPQVFEKTISILNENKENSDSQKLKQLKVDIQELYKEEKSKDYGVLFTLLVKLSRTLQTIFGTGRIQSYESYLEGAYKKLVHKIDHEINTTLLKNKIQTSPEARALDDRFQKSVEDVPEITLHDYLWDKVDRQKYLNKEVDRLNSFLSDHQSTKEEEDLVYICIGAGHEPEQIFPGFVFEALQEDKKVKLLYFEYLWKNSSASKGIAEQYMHYQDQQEGFEKKLNNLAIEQFLCGLPSLDEQTIDRLKEGVDGNLYWTVDNGDGSYMRETFYGDMDSNCYWEKEEQVNMTAELFPKYIENLLMQGKQVVIGYHVDGMINHPTELLKYNKWVQKYPGQIHLLFSRIELNKNMTNTEIDPNPYNFDPTLWKSYDNLSSQKGMLEK